MKEIIYEQKDRKKAKQKTMDFARNIGANSVEEVQVYLVAEQGGYCVVGMFLPMFSADKIEQQVVTHYGIVQASIDEFKERTGVGGNIKVCSKDDYENAQRMARAFMKLSVEDVQQILKGIR